VHVSTSLTTINLSARTADSLASPVHWVDARGYYISLRSSPPGGKGRRGVACKYMIPTILHRLSENKSSKVIVKTKNNTQRQGVLPFSPLSDLRWHLQNKPAAVTTYSTNLPDIGGSEV
jgi:hypothetical protein